MAEATKVQIPPIDHVVFQARAAAAASFDAMHGGALDDAVGEISKVYNLLLLWFLKSGGPLSIRYDAVALLNRAFDILVSSLHMIRQRANVEGLILLRACLETTAAALHIFFDEEARAE